MRGTVAKRLRKRALVLSEPFKSNTDIFAKFYHKAYKLLKQQYGKGTKT